MRTGVANGQRDKVLVLVLVSGVALAVASAASRLEEARTQGPWCHSGTGRAGPYMPSPARPRVQGGGLQRTALAFKELQPKGVPAEAEGASTKGASTKGALT